MDTPTIDLLCATFAMALEIQEDNALGQPSPENIDNWYALMIRGYSAIELLESVHRHVTCMREAEATGQQKLMSHHLDMLGFVAEEIERRREVLT